MAFLSYTQRREISGRYVMRKSLPKSLAGEPAPAFVRARFGDELVNLETGCFKRELKISARTADPASAKLHNTREAARVSQLIADIERAMVAGPEPRALNSGVQPALSVITDDAVQRIVNSVQAEYWQADESFRTEPDERLERLDVRGPDLTPLTKGADEGMEEDAYEAAGVVIQNDLAGLREALARNDISEFRRLTRSHAIRLGFDFDGLDDASQRRISREALKGAVEIVERLARRHNGEPIGFEPMKPKALGPKLSEAFERWKSGGGGRDGRRPAANTILEATVAVNQFIGLFGDLRLGAITKAKAREYRDTIAKVPKGLPKALRQLPLSALLRKDLSDYEMRSSATLNKGLTMLEATAQQAIKDGFMDEVAGFANPFSGLRFAKSERLAEERKPFDPSDLEKLFGLAIFRQGERPRGGGGEAAFWFPLIALFAGMRLEEIAGLRVGELRKDEATGICIFDVRPNDVRGLKTASSNRFVPVHPELIRMGLLRYRDGLSEKWSDAPLWPDLRQTTQRLSQPWSKWFGRMLREGAGICDTAKVFHSFRHTFKRMARDAGLTEEMHDALTGHAGGGSIGRGYGKGFGLRALSEAMSRIAAPIDLSALCWSVGEHPAKHPVWPPRPQLRTKPRSGKQ